MTWHIGLIIFIGLPLMFSAFLCWLMSRRRNPIIMDKPQADPRNSIYSVGRHIK